MTHVITVCLQSRTLDPSAVRQVGSGANCDCHLCRLRSLGPNSHFLRTTMTHHWAEFEERLARSALRRDGANNGKGHQEQKGSLHASGTDGGECSELEVRTLSRETMPAK